MVYNLLPPHQSLPLSEDENNISFNDFSNPENPAFAGHFITKQEQTTLSNSNLDELICSLLEPEIDLVSQAQFRNTLAKARSTYHQAFSPDTLKKRRKLIDLDYFDVSDKFQLSIDNDYEAVSLFDIRNQRNSLDVNRSDFVNINETLCEHYETNLPYYEYSHIFEGYSVSRFKISAHSCSSSLLNLKLHIIYSTNESYYSNNHLNGGKVNIIHQEEFISSRGSPTRPLVGPTIGNTRIPFVFQGGFFPGILNSSVADKLTQSSEDVVELISQFVVSINSTTGDVAAKVGKLSDKLSKLLDSIEHPRLEKIAKDYEEKFSSSFNIDTLTTSLCKNLSVIITIVSGTYCIYERSTSSLTIFVGALVATFYFNRAVALELFQKWSASFFGFDRAIQMQDVLVAQGGVIADDFFTGAISVLSGLIFVSTPVTKLPKEILSSITSFDKAKATLKDLFDFFIRVMDSVLEYFNSKISVPSWVKHINVSKSNIQEYFENCDVISREIKDGNFAINYTNWDRIEELKRTSRHIALEIKNTSPTTNQIFSQQNMWLEKLASKFRESNFTCDGMRQKPVAIVIAGKPGTGKSQTMEWLARGIAKTILPEELQESFDQKPSDFIYPRCAEAKFWEGYNSRKIVTTFDDIGQIRDVAGNADCEMMNFIRMSDELSYACNMGSLEAKGCTFFTSKAIIATTNNIKFSTEAIHEPKAVKRRVDIAVFCVVKPEFAFDYITPEGGTYQKLDKTKLPKNADGTTWVDPHILFDYIEYDMDTGKLTGRQWSYNELFNLVMVKYFDYRDQFILKTEKLKDYCSSITPICRIPTAAQREFVLEHQTDKDLDFEEPSMVLFEPKAQFSQEFDRIKGMINDLMVSQGGSPIRRRGWSHNGSKFRVFTVSEAIDSGFCSEKLNDYFSNLSHAERAKFDYNLSQLRTHCSFVNPTVLYLDEHQWWGMLEFSIPKTIFNFHTDYPVDYMGLLAKDLRFCYPNLPLNLENDLNWRETIYNLFAKADNWIFSKFGTSFTKAFQYLKTNYAQWIGIISLVTAMVGMFKFSSHMLKPKEEATGIVQSLEQKDLTKSRGQKFLAKHAKAGVAQMASGRDKNGSDLIQKYIYSNCYEMILEGEKSKTNFGFITFLKGKLAIMPYHFVSMLGEMDNDNRLNVSDKILFRCNKINNKTGEGLEVPHFFKITVEDFIPCVKISDLSIECDLALIEFPKYVRMHADITKLIPHVKDINKMRDLNVCLTIPKVNNKQEAVGVARALDNYPCTLTADSKDIFTIRTGYKYNVRTEHGDCGAWLSIQDPNYPYKLIGIHSAGDNASNGFATALIYENIMEIIEEAVSGAGEHVDQNCLLYHPSLGIDEPAPPMVSQGQFVEIMTIAKVPSRGGGTDIIPSGLHNTYTKALTKPAVLFPVKRGNKMVDPNELALEKYCLPYVYIDNEIELAGEMYYNTINNYTNYTEPRLYTFEEAVQGVEGEAGFNSLSRKTSCGYPYNTLGFKKKFTHFGEGDLYDLTTPACAELRLDVDLIIKQAISGLRSVSIFHDNLKDERRSIEKVEACKTRMFSSSPLHLTIVNRIYFGAFCLFYYKNRMQNGSAIGVNPYSPEWHEIYTNLMSNGSKYDTCVGAGDFSRYDGSQKGRIHWIILDIINKWYDDGPVNQKIREVLWLELTNSYHLNGHSVVMWPDSLPSGHTLTLIVNTMYNNIAFRYCWLQAVKGTTIAISDYDRYVYLIAMGDDNLFSVAPQVRDIFNEITISKYMLQLGLTYTNETKTHSTVLLRKVCDVEFLKRGFRHSSEVGRCVAPLQLEVVLEVPMWTKKSEPDGIMKTNVDYAIKELSLHGRKTFDYYVPQIVRAMRDHCNSAPSNISYTINLEEALNSVAPY